MEKQGRIFPDLPEEDAQIETAVKLTGLTKQDYIIRRLLCRDVVVLGNPIINKGTARSAGCCAGRATPY